MNKTQQNPKVSVIVPAYNAEQFIDETLESVLAQTFQNFEVIVVDDSSTDRTKEVVNKFVTSDNRFILIEQPHLGTAAARNEGIKNSRGDLIAFLDNDDLWCPNKIIKQISYMERDSSIHLISCLAVIIDEKGISQGLISGKVLNGNCYRKILSAEGISGGSIILAKRKCFDIVGPFDPLVGLYADWDMWIRLLSKFQISTVPEVLVGYRRRQNSASRDYFELMKSGEFVLKKTFNADPTLPEKYYTFCFARDIMGIGAWCFVDGQHIEAWKLVSRAVQMNPFACLTDLRRLGVFVLLVLATIFPKQLFQELIMKKVLPGIFGLKYGEHFAKMCK